MAKTVVKIYWCHKGASRPMVLLVNKNFGWFDSEPTSSIKAMLNKPHGWSVKHQKTCNYKLKYLGQVTSYEEFEIKFPELLI